MRDLEHITHFYFIGIGGIGMSALARYLHAQGKQVAGYDRVATSLSRQLEEEGIAIHYQGSYDQIPQEYKNPQKSQVVYTPAVPLHFDELVRFRESGIPITKRAQLLGQISKTMTCLAIAGTHGKTTTSAILAHLLYQSEVKVTAFLGGILEGYRTNYLNSGTDVMVVEADEFDRSFLQLQPDYAGITAMDPDHLDIYGDENEFQKAFEEFSQLVPEDRLFVTEKVSISGNIIGASNGDYHLKNLIIEQGAYHFDVVTPNETLTDCSFKLPGRHNLSNALLALAIALELKVSPNLLKRALSSFKGVERRFSYKLVNEKYTVIDDYAHHPTEIDAVYQAVNEMYHGQPCTVIFQPHLFSRTRDFMEDFAKSLGKFDKVGILEIYPAREEPLEGINAAALASKITELPEPPAKCQVVDKKELTDFIERSDNGLVLMLGAGDIGVEIERVCKELQA